MRREDSVIEYMPRQVLNRHWLWVFLWTVVGVLLAWTSGTPAFLLATASAIAGLVILFAPISVPRRSHIGIALLFLALGCFLFLARKPDATGDALHRYALSYPTQQMTFAGMVSNTHVYHQEKNYLSFELDVESMLTDGQSTPITGKALVRWSRAAGPVYSGARVRVYGRLSPHISVTNFGAGGLENHYRDRGIFSVIHGTGNAVEEVQPGYFSPRYWAGRLRQWQSDKLTAVTPKSVHPFINGVWLGERGLISKDVYDQFIHAGTAHVLAVSGVHVAIIAFSMNFLLSMLRLPRRARLLMLMAGLILFAMMTGARTATLRATFMLMLYFTYDWFERDPDSLSVLGLCGVVFLLWNPNTLFDPGFLMSFGGVGSIMVFYPGMIFLMSRLPRILSASLTTTVSVQVVTLPIAAWYFQLVPITGIVANIIVVPLLTVTLWLCFVTMLIATIAPPVAMIFGYALLPVITIIHWTNRVAGSLPFAFTTVLRPSFFALLFYTIAALYFYRVLYDEKQRRRNLVVMGMLLLMAIVFWRPFSEKAQVDFIDVGHGDSILVRTPGGTVMLVDGGDASEYKDAGEWTVLPFLYANGVSCLDYVVVSHNDRDHIGGLFHILEHIPVDTVIMGPERQNENVLEQQFLNLCEAQKIKVVRVAAGDVLPAEGADIHVLHPPANANYADEENNYSLVLHVAWEDFSLLLCGDIEAEAEAQLIQTGLNPVSVLKAPHHGSATSSTKIFLEQVHPDVAVVSVQPADKDGSFVPDIIMERYQDMGIPIFRTDWHGGIRIRERGGKLLVNTARGNKGYTLEPDGM